MSGKHQQPQTWETRMAQSAKDREFSQALAKRQEFEDGVHAEAAMTEIVVAAAAFRLTEIRRMFLHGLMITTVYHLAEAQEIVDEYDALIRSLSVPSAS